MDGESASKHLKSDKRRKDSGPKRVIRIDAVSIAPANRNDK